MTKGPRINTVDIESEYHARVCRNCGKLLNVYNGMCDHEEEPARSFFDNRIRALRKDYSAVQSGIHMLLSYMGPGKKLKLSEISEAVSLIVSSDEVTPQILGQKDGEQKE